MNGIVPNQSNDVLDELNITIDENAELDEAIREYEEDEQFMQECTEACLPLLLQTAVMSESYLEQMDESVKAAYATLTNYLAAQGVISEAAVSLANPKINVVRLNKQAQIRRLTTIITLKMGRKADHKAYKKYKLGQKIKKDNLMELRKFFGAKAERLAKKVWMKTHKGGKLAAVVDSVKGNKSNK